MADSAFILHFLMELWHWDCRLHYRPANAVWLCLERGGWKRPARTGNPIIHGLLICSILLKMMSLLIVASSKKAAGMIHPGCLIVLNLGASRLFPAGSTVLNYGLAASTR